MPYLPAISLFFASASWACPVPATLSGSSWILIGAFKVVPVIIVIATFGLVFASVYSLIAIHRAYFGPSQSDEPILGLDARELSMVLGLAVLLVLRGLPAASAGHLRGQHARRAAMAGRSPFHPCRTVVAK